MYDISGVWGKYRFAMLLAVTFPGGDECEAVYGCRNSGGCYAAEDGGHDGDDEGGLHDGK